MATDSPCQLYMKKAVMEDYINQKCIVKVEKSVAQKNVNAFKMRRKQ